MFAVLFCDATGRRDGHYLAGHRETDGRWVLKDTDCTEKTFSNEDRQKGTSVIVCGKKMDPCRLVRTTRRTTGPEVIDARTLVALVALVAMVA